MLLLDRPLSPAEAAEAAGRPHLDLAALHAPPDGPLQARLLRWVDRIEAHPFNGQDAQDFFGVGGRSYWLHVRMRLFFALFGDAQLLDRLPDLGLLGRAERVYCTPGAAAFWRRWAPQAERVLSPPPDRPPAPRPSPLDRARALAADLAALRRELRRGAEGLVFSPQVATVARDGALTDAQLGPLLDRRPDAWLRVEYVPPPSRQSAPPPDLPRRHRTVRTDAVLAAYALRHPAALARFGADLRALRRRFRAPLHHTVGMHWREAEWTALLHAEVRRLAPSIALFRLQQDAYAWLARRAGARFVFATGESNSPGRVMIEAGRRVGLPTFGIQHGTIAPHNVDYRLSAREAAGGTPDHFFAWGEAVRDYLVRESHFPAAGVHAVGQLSFDALRPEPDAALVAFGEALGRPVLLFASQPQQNPENRAAAARALARFCAAEGLACAVKLHPREPDDGLYARAFAEAGVPDRLRLHDGPLYDAIAACDFGATCFSTVAWEVMSAGKPLVVFDPFGLDLLRLRGQPAVYHVPDADGPPFAAWRARLPEHVAVTQTLAAAEMGPRDGRVADRILEVMDCVVDGKERAADLMPPSPRPSPPGGG